MSHAGKSLGRLSWPNMRNALPQIWRKRPCDKGTSVRCTCRTARKLIPSAQSLALATKTRKTWSWWVSTQWEVKTCVHSNYVLLCRWQWVKLKHASSDCQLREHDGTWWNMAKDETSTSQLLGTEPLANKKPGEHQWFSMFNATSTKQLVQWHLTHG